MSLRIKTLLFLSCSTALMAAEAQTHRCIVNGTNYISDRPCVSDNKPAPARLVAAGPLPPPATQRQQQLPAQQRAPEHHRFLSQRCAELNDALRTGPSRGVGYSTMQDLQREYQRDCSEDDMMARQRMSDERSKARENVRQAKQRAEQSREDELRLQERCVALRDAARARRADGDQALSQKAQEAFKMHCLGR